MNLENLYLKLKHWQLFLIFFLSMFILQIGMIPTLILSKEYNYLGIIIGLFTGLGVLLFLGWFYFIIKGLDKKIENQNLRIYKKYFLYLLLFPVLYLTIVLSVLPQGFTISTEGSTIKTIWQVFIIPAHLFSMFCIFSCFIRLRKQLKSRIAKKVTFSDFAGEFFLYGFLLLEFGFYSQKLTNL
jgi:hypothetical protein